MLTDRTINETLEHPINRVTRQDIHAKPPMTFCEACGIEKPRDQMINVIMQIGSPGHGRMPPFQCLGGTQSLGEHWACSIECYRVVAIACLDEHIIPFLEYIHENIIPRLKEMDNAYVPYQVRSQTPVSEGEPKSHSNGHSNTHVL